jgi:hypothetical protein
MVTKSTKTVSPAATRAPAPADSSSFVEIEVVDSQPNENENSIYESDVNEGGESVGSTDTAYADDADYEGPYFLGPEYCRVILSNKTDRGETLCCGKLIKECTRSNHSLIRTTKLDRVAHVGRYTGKSNNKDQVDEVLVMFQSQADYEALKAKDRAAMLALGQSDHKKAAEALLSPKQRAVTFDTSGAPPSRSHEFVSRIPTPITFSPALSASSRKPKLTVDTGPSSATKTPMTEKEVMAKSTVKSVANAQVRSDKTVVTDRYLKLREALEINANLTGMVEALMSKQKETAAAGYTVAKRKKSRSKAAKPHYYAVACGWHVGVFKVPTDLKEYQKATLDFPKHKLNTKRFATRKAASSWLQEELADSDEEQDFR